MRKPLTLLILIFLLAVPMASHALDGFDYKTGDYIEIQDTGPIARGQEIEIYDYHDDSYHDAQVVSITRNATTEIEIYDYDLDKYRTFEMEDSK